MLSSRQDRDAADSGIEHSAAAHFGDGTVEKLIDGRCRATRWHGIEDAKQLANAVRFRAQEALPIPIDEAVLDYQVLGEGVTEEGEPTRRILLVVAYRELIDRYVDACKKAGITLAGIDLEASAGRCGELTTMTTGSAASMPKRTSPRMLVSIG